MRVAVYPGSFDPVTYGHLDVIRRAAAAFDRVVVAVLENPNKAPLLAAPERIALLRASIADELPGLVERVKIVGFEGLTVDVCRAHDARFIVRGVRGASDLESEALLAQNNRRLAPEIDTVLLPSSPDVGYVSSSLAREIARFGGDVRHLVPAVSAAALAVAARRAAETGPAGGRPAGGEVR